MKKGVTDGRTDRRTDGRTERSVLRAAWSQLKIKTIHFWGWKQDYWSRQSSLDTSYLILAHEIYLIQNVLRFTPLRQSVKLKILMWESLNKTGRPKPINAHKSNALCIIKIPFQGIWHVLRNTRHSNGSATKLCYAMEWTNSFYWCRVFVWSKCIRFRSSDIYKVVIYAVII